MHLINEEILQPTIDSMQKEGPPFVGIICIGVILTTEGPKLIEYNVRFGDPEAQILLPLLDQDIDLAEVLLACLERKLDRIPLTVKNMFASHQGDTPPHPKPERIYV
ncbi:hypothetical protein BFW01_g1678 [Lasiodiplodia theobromae]|nr:hypothetical protein BFW01_g1678 [Lasiodiplodia theobromae]